MSSSSFPSRQLPGDDTVTTSTSTVSTETNPTAPPPPPSPSTTTTFIPFPTPSPSPTSPQQPGAFFSGGASPSLIAGFISIGAFALAIFAICAWSKFIRRRRGGTAVGPPDSGFVDRILPARFRRRRLAGQFGEGEEGGQEGGEGGEGEGEVYRRGRRRWRQGRGREHGRSNELSRAKPEMFDAWIEKGRAVDNTSKWEAESVPLSARLFTSGPPGPGPVETAGMGMAEVSSRAGRDSVEEEDEEKRCLTVQQMRGAATGSSTLQVAVLLQMPAPPPPPSHTVTEAQNDISVRGELVIGLVEAPWTRDSEHPFSREGEETTTS